MKIISGGQTGVDQAALRAAKHVGFDTGGFLPHGCMTLEGVRDDLLTLYNMIEHSGAYAERTDANVAEAQVTIRIARSFSSAGEKCTLAAIKKHNKPYLDLPVCGYGPEAKVQADKIKIAHQLGQYDIINVAGNSEETAVGIGEIAYKFLVEVFNLMKKPLVHVITNRSEFYSHVHAMIKKPWKFPVFAGCLRPGDEVIVDNAWPGNCPEVKEVIWNRALSTPQETIRTKDSMCECGVGIYDHPEDGRHKAHWPHSYLHIGCDLRYYET